MASSLPLPQVQPSDSKACLSLPHDRLSALCFCVPVPKHSASTTKQRRIKRNAENFLWGFAFFFGRSSPTVKQCVVYRERRASCMPAASMLNVERVTCPRLPHINTNRRQYMHPNRPLAHTHTHTSLPRRERSSAPAPPTALHSFPNKSPFPPHTLSLPHPQF